MVYIRNIPLHWTIGDRNPRPKEGEAVKWKDIQKNDINNKASEIITPNNKRNVITNKITYFLINSLNKSLHQ